MLGQGAREAVGVSLSGTGATITYLHRPPLFGLKGGVPDIPIHAGVTVTDGRGLKGVRQVPRSVKAVMLAVLGLTVFVGLIIAPTASIALAGVLIVTNLGDARTPQHGPLRDGTADIRPAALPRGG